MKSSIKDKAEGALRQLKGKVKEVAGIISDSPKLQAEGTAEKMAGKVQMKIGKLNQFWGR